jgi:hypothetical protein
MTPPEAAQLGLRRGKHRAERGDRVLAVLPEPAEVRHVARAHGDDHRTVLVQHELPMGHLVVVDRSVDLGGIRELADQAGQPRQRAGVDEREVEPAVRLGHRDDVLVCSRGTHVELELVQPVEVVGGEHRHGGAHCFLLEQLPDPVDLEQVCQGQLGEMARTSPAPVPG